MAAARDSNWQDWAQCNGTDGEAFFPDKGGSTKYAKKICSRCPVTAECLEDALDKNEQYGVRGGLSENQRRALKRRAA